MSLLVLKEEMIKHPSFSTEELSEFLLLIFVRIQPKFECSEFHYFCENPMFIWIIYTGLLMKSYNSVAL